MELELPEQYQRLVRQALGWYQQFYEDVPMCNLDHRTQNRPVSHSGRDSTDIHMTLNTI